MTLINGDCLEEMRKMKDKSVDLVLTDPPYAVGTTSTGVKGSWLDNNLIRPFFERLFGQIKRIGKYGIDIYINTDWRTYPFLYPLAERFFVVKNCIVWDYEWIKAGSHYRFSHEFILFCLNGNSKRKFSANKRDVWRIAPLNFTRINKLHQQEKPLRLVKECLLNSSKENDLILDPFMGSGTTGCACKELGRRFIGIEIDKGYYDIACKRIANTMKSMF